MASFSKILIQIRKQFYPHSAKAAWVAWSAQGLKINYAYYMRLEQGKAFPTSEIINQIVRLLPQIEAERLIKGFCASLFPKHSYLFSIEGTSANNHDKFEDILKAMTQSELTPAQISILADSKGNYHLFLICTLARRPIKKTELMKYFSKAELEKSTRQLVQSKIIAETANGYRSYQPDVVFPKADTDFLTDSYKTFDEWDKQFGDLVQLDKVINKMLLRRVSYRYLHLIQKQLDLVFDLVRSSDELDLRYNESIIQLQVVLKKGQVHG